MSLETKLSNKYPNEIKSDRGSPISKLWKTQNFGVTLEYVLN
jgi:hypothetical protein